MLVVQLFKMTTLRNILFPAPSSKHLVINRGYLLCSVDHSSFQIPPDEISCLSDVLIAANSARLEAWMAAPNLFRYCNVHYDTYLKTKFKSKDPWAWLSIVES